MASMTFLINDSSTEAGVPVVQVVISENADGSVTFTISQLDVAGSYLGDLRGLFFDLADESLIGSLSATSSALLTELRQGDDSIKDLGDGANMNGLLGSNGGYDVGVEIGSSGIGKDDVRSFSFTLSTTQAGGLSLSDFSNVSFGARITSVGVDTNGDSTIDTSRTGSAKTGETTFAVITPTNDAAGVTEDTMSSGNVLTNDGATALDTLSVAGWTGGALGATVAPAALMGATVTLGANGSWTVDASGADQLAAGQTATQTFSYTVLQTNVDGTATYTAQFTVTVTGTNDAPTISAAVASGGVSEDATDPTLSTTGTITFDDVDLIDAHSVSAVAAGGNPLGGTLTPVVSDAASGAGDGTVTWTYSVANAAAQHLAAGQTATEDFTVTIDDGHGGTVSQLVTITVTGTNDAPVLAVDASGGVTEDAANPTLSDSGALSFSDVDVTDGHTVSSTYNNDALWSGGALTLAQVAALSGGFSADADSWDYSVANSALQFLGVGETITLSFDVTVSDDSGAPNDSDTETVTLTLTGTNDAPVLTVDTSGEVTEDITLSDSGTLSFTDVDVTDGHTVSSAYNGDAVWSGGVLTPAQVAALTGGFVPTPTAGTTAWPTARCNSWVPVKPSR